MRSGGPRLTGGFAWKAPADTLRGATFDPSDAALRYADATSRLQDRAATDPTSGNVASLGAAFLLVGQQDRAVTSHTRANLVWIIRSGG